MITSNLGKIQAEYLPNKITEHYYGTNLLGINLTSK